MPRQPPSIFTTRLADWDITLKQAGPNNFTVIYGLQIKSHLNYSDAAHELGCCIMHALACEGKLDNRTKAEARNDQG